MNHCLRLLFAVFSCVTATVYTEASLSDHSPAPRSAEACSPPWSAGDMTPQQEITTALPSVAPTSLLQRDSHWKPKQTVAHEVEERSRMKTERRSGSHSHRKRKAMALTAAHAGAHRHRGRGRTHRHRGRGKTHRHRGRGRISSRQKIRKVLAERGLSLQEHWADASLGCHWQMARECVPWFQFEETNYSGCAKNGTWQPWCSHNHSYSGKSDKPVDPATLTFAKHVTSIEALFDHLDLCSVTLVMQDWGGMIGTGALPLLNLKRLVIMDTWPGPQLHDLVSFFVFQIWQGYVRYAGRDLLVGDLCGNFSVGSSGKRPSDDVFEAYDAPFPGPEYKAMVATWPLFYHHGPAGVFPLLQSSQQWAADHLTIPVLVAFADDDMLWNANMAFPLIRRWLKKAHVERHDILNACHFLQEGNPDAIVDSITSFIARHP